MRMKDKVVVITGAGGGMGRATAVKLAREGARLALVDINEAALRQTLALVKEQNAAVETLTVKADVAREEEVRNYIEQTVSRFGRIDGFFNNAGIEGHRDFTADYPFDKFNETIDIDLKGVFLGLKYVLGVMKIRAAGVSSTPPPSAARGR